jgi:hypothetical protein
MSYRVEFHAAALAQLDEREQALRIFDVIWAG